MWLRFMAAFAAWTFAAVTQAFAQIGAGQTLGHEMAVDRHSLAEVERDPGSTEMAFAGVIRPSASSGALSGALKIGSPVPPIESLRTGDNGVLSVCNDQRSICKDGRHVFLLGDTAWNAHHRLTIDQWRSYLAARREQGFDFTMIVGAMSNRRDNPIMESNVAGEMPVIGGDFRRVGQAYWSDFDRWVKEARRQGLFVGVLPVWSAAYFPDDPSSRRTDRLTIATAYRYCHDVAEMLKDNDNIMWVLGGDHGPTKTVTLSDDTKEKLDYRTIIDRCAEGVADSVNGVDDGFNRRADWSTSFIVYHTWTWGSTCPTLTDRKWLRFNAVQTGHPNVPPQDYTGACWNQTPPKPVANLEPWYENVGKVSTRWNPDGVVAGPREVRRDAWWSVIGLGTALHVYGHNSIYRFCGTPTANRKCDGQMSWTEAMEAPGANDMRHVKALMSSLSAPWVPDDSLLVNPLSGFDRLVAARGPDYRIAYTYDGNNSIHLRLSGLGPTLGGFWYNPRTGAKTDLATFPNPGTKSFTAPDSNDWVLVVENG